MRAVRYTGGHTRVLRVSDLDILGVPHKSQDLVWDKENNFTIVMSNQMSDSLVERLPTEFIAEEVDETDDANSTSQSHPKASQSDPESSVASGDDDVRRSTHKRSKNE